MGLPYAVSYPTSYAYGGAFPPNFTWGLGTAAYQIEGGWESDGRGPSIWDAFTGSGGVEPNPGMEVPGDTGEIACDHYHRWRDDIALMSSLGLRAYRFSISWSRLLPNGTLAGGTNERGISFYSELIDGLLAAGITPYVTLYHWDLPQALQTHALPGWLSREVVNHFADFAELCFRRFGDRVRMWTTFNGARHPDQPWSREPRAPAAHFSSPTRAPQRRGRSPFLGTALARRRRASRSQTSAGTRTWRGIMCSSRTPKQCAASERARAAAGGSASRITLTGASRRAVLRRTLLLRSAPTSGGSAGLPTRSGSATTLRRCAQSSASHCLPPSLAHATWSPMLTRTVSPPGERLPAFTADERRMLHGSADFFGLNHYGSRLAKARPTGPMYGEDGGDPFSYWADAEVQTLHPEEWPASASVWLFSVPWGLRKLLNWIDRRYGRPPIYVTENGWSTPGGEDVAAAVADSGRVAFYANYTSEMQRAINEDGVDVRGYFAWSLFDNFEWSCVAPSNGPAHALGSHTSLSAGSAATRSASA